ncbi:acyltransferase [Spartinivicinus poritis]|uniref:Acyltransferase n=1 Tax=Spartinivicinus poritis TaxID=2994640 RepID=A0ABT5UAX3_9GAMM|nr:acyltransferase [Spartinivicinus sp. A2-2]MDE1463524.1 acyltransferase [Spartinivicinus sp. A2-2]
MIDKTAIIDERAMIGENCNIWINTQIRENARIGNHCTIGKDVYIDHDVIIGNGCKIQNSVSIFYGVTIYDDVFIGPHVCFTNDKVPRAFNQEWQVSPTVVLSGASIGANTTLICGITIGEYAMIAAGSVVTHDVAPFSLVIGNPARHIGYVDKAGHRVNRQPCKDNKR